MIIRGYNQGINLGTVGDWYCDPVSGNDTNVGTEISPFKTISKALQMVSPGQTIKLKGGTYREAVSMISGTSGNLITISRYGSEVPVISGAEVMSGFVPCVASDASRVGPNWSNVYKKTSVSNSQFVTNDPHSANLFENGTRLIQALAWEGLNRGNKFYQGWYHDHFLADNIITNDGMKTTGVSLLNAYKSTSVTTTYTEAEIKQCMLIGTMYPNVQFRTGITSVTGDTITLNQNTTPNFKYAGSGNQGAERFALVNMLKEIEHGQWAFWDNGDGTSDFYVWPHNSADIDKIEYSARSHCILANNKNYWRFEGIEFRQSTGSAQGRDDNTGYGDGTAIVNSALQMNYQNELVHCKVSGTYGTNKTYSVRLAGCTNLLVEFCLFEDGMEHTGLFLSGNQSGAHIVDALIRRNVFKNIAGSPMAVYSADKMIVAHNFFDSCGLVAHSNKMNWYQDSHNMLFFGNEYTNTAGYITDQEATDSYVIGNLIPADYYSSNNARAYITQGHTEGPQTGQVYDSLFFNNTCPPHPSSLSAQNGVTLGSTSANYLNIFWKQYNNLYHGDASPASQINAKDYNVDTASNASTVLNNIAGDVNTIYTNVSNKDWTILPSAIIRTTTGKDMTTEINLLKTIFTRFSDWNLDYKGNTIDWSAANVGAEQFATSGSGSTTVTGNISVVITFN